MKGIVQNVIIYKCLKIHILINSFTVHSSKKKKSVWNSYCMSDSFSYYQKSEDKLESSAFKVANNPFWKCNKHSNIIYGGFWDVFRNWTEQQYWALQLVDRCFLLELYGKLSHGGKIWLRNSDHIWPETWTVRSTWLSSS